MGGSFARSAFRRRALFIALVLVTPLLASPAHADDPLDPVLGNPGHTYPDLVPDTTEVYLNRPVIAFENGEFVYGLPEVRFDTYSQNLGTVPLDLVTDDPTALSDTAVSQCVSWRAPFVCRERTTVGGFTWHAEHSHFHYEDFASYEVRRVGRDGNPDYSAKGLVGRSDKVSFCLIDSIQVRPDAVPAPTYVLCTPVREGISPGWADIYTSDLEGQSVSLHGAPDGRYALIITLDSANTVFESDNTNNRVEVIIDISNGGNTLNVVRKQYPILGSGGCPGNGKGKGKGSC